MMNTLFKKGDEDLLAWKRNQKELIDAVLLNL